MFYTDFPKFCILHIYFEFYVTLSFCIEFCFRNFMESSGFVDSFLTTVMVKSSLKVKGK